MVHEMGSERGRRGAGRRRARLALTLIGAAALVVGVFLDWTTGSATGDKLTLRSLVQNDFGTTDDMLRTVGAVSVLIAVVALLGLLDRTGWLTRLAGFAAVVLFAMFAVEVFRHHGEHFGPAYDALRPGAWCQLGGGVVLGMSGLVRYRRKHAGKVRKQATSADAERERLAAETLVQQPVPSDVGASSGGSMGAGTGVGPGPDSDSDVSPVSSPGTGTTVAG